MLNLRRKEIIGIALLVLLGFTLRLYGITNEGNTLDESLTIFNSKKSLMHMVTLDDPNPFLYLLIVHPFVKYSEDALFWSRVPFIIFGAMTIFFIFVLGRKLFNAKIGFYSAILLTISPFHVYFSQEARSYSLLVFSTLLSSYYFIELLSKNNRKNQLLYFLSTIVLLYSHFYSIFVLVVQNIYFLLLQKNSKKFRMWMLMQAFFVLAYVPVLINLYSYLINNNSLWIRRIFLTDILNFHYIISGGRHLSIILPLLFLLGLYILFFDKFEKKSHPNYILLLFFIPLLLPLFYTVVLSPIFLPKYIIYVIIPYFIVISLGLSKINRYFRYTLFIIIIALCSFNIYQQAKTIEKGIWISVDYNVKQINNIDAIIINPGYIVYPLIYYYHNDCFSAPDIYQCAAENDVFTIWNEFEKEKNFTEYNNHIVYITKFTQPSTEDYYLEYLMTKYSEKKIINITLDKYSTIFVYDFIKK